MVLENFLRREDYDVAHCPPYFPAVNPTLSYREIWGIFWERGILRRKFYFFDFVKPTYTPLPWWHERSNSQLQTANCQLQVSSLDCFVVPPRNDAKRQLQTPNCKLPTLNFQTSLNSKLLTINQLPPPLRISGKFVRIHTRVRENFVPLRPFTNGETLMVFKNIKYW